MHLESDSFFDFIRAGYVEPWEPESHDQNRVVMQIVAEAAAGYAAAGYFTIIDGIVIPGWFLDPLRSVLHGAGHRVAYAVLRAPLSVCAARVRSRDDSLADPKVVEQLWHDFSDLGDLEANAVDLGGKTPDEAVHTLEQLLAEESLTI